MKKKCRFIMAATFLLTVPVVINRLIDKCFANKAVKKQREFNYDWVFGNVKYTKRGHGEPLLLLHSLTQGSGSHEWNQCINALSKYYTVYAPDLIGFGNSHKPGISYSAYLYTSLINDFIENVVGQPVFLAAAGNSADFAVLSTKFKPGNFLKLMLISPEGLKEPEARRCPYRGKLLELPIYGTFAYNLLCSIPGLWIYLKKFLFSQSTKVTMDTLKDYHRSAHYGGSNNRYPIAALVSGKLDWNVSEAIEEIEVPVHITRGIDGSGYLPHSEKPFLFTKLLLDFLS